MRQQAKIPGLSVQAIAGSYVVLLGMNMPKTAVKGVLGFAIERIDHTEDERYWLKGFKTFEETDPSVPTGSLVSSLEHPIQAFLWGDFTAKPNHNYTYRVVAMRGKPKKLEPAETVEISIQTEDEDQGTHAVYFNRGVAGSQAYARKFKNKKPEQVAKNAAWTWLSRGLVEALLAFIAQAKGGKYSLRAALYEFQYQPVLEAFGAAAKSGADVKIVYDARENRGNYPNKANRAAIDQADIEVLTIPRQANPSYIAHNKFIVLLKDGQPVQVWTGSTNITDGGLYGHSNVGHVVRDAKIASQFLDYWTALSQDTSAKALRPLNDDRTPVPQKKLKAGEMHPIFSPRSTLEALDWYAQQMDTAKSAIFFTAAFGVNDQLESILSQDKDYLRYILLEKDGGDIESLRRDQDNRIAVGSVMKDTRNRKDDQSNEQSGEILDRWNYEKTTDLNTHVRFIHTKYLLVDPLGKTPLVITGSANFSEASTRNNDENMLLIQGDTRVADIYLGEFMRLFNHFYTRYWMQVNRTAETAPSRYLVPDDSWTAEYYVKDSPKAKERLYFSGK